MGKVVELATRHLKSMKLEIANKYGIMNEEWRLPALRDIVQSNQTLSHRDAERIGLGTALKIARLQGIFEAHRKMQPNNCDDLAYIDNMIRREITFGEEY